ncbi:MAG: hypothetical protein K0S27_1706 [Gammaproteobacteria bacterium]|jgi:hypothetical protein|nr:hypothetical protein [Gammaproteobacteria bacterium]
MLLEMWFGVQIILLNDIRSSQDIQQILRSNWMLIHQHHFQYVNMVFNIFHKMKNIICSFLMNYINRNNIEVFLNVLEITLTRACLFIEFIPCMMVILFIFIIDGLILRDKRKFQGARESTFLFHQLKSLARLSFFLLFFIYMINPYHILPLFFLLPMAILFSLFTMFSIRNFKKYL